VDLMAKYTQRALIVGGGPVGLATAMLLARDGFEALVIEKDPQGAPSSADAAWNWDRKGVAQFRQPNLLLPRFRQLVEREFPEVAEGLQALGARRVNLVETLAPPLRSPLAGDERFEILSARRPVTECAFAQAAEDTPGVKILRGVSVAGLVPGTSTRVGVPHVAGVRTSDGAEMAADVIIDAMGRRSKLGEWLKTLGAPPFTEEASDAGFAYYTRHFRASGAVPDIRGPFGGPVGTLGVLTIPADNDCWTVALVPLASDRPMKTLRENAVWERVVATVPRAAHWLDGEPLGDVRPMAGVMDRYRRFVVDDTPVVTGAVAVGDAWACTNPTAGRGLSLGLAHAVILRDTLRNSPDPFTLAVELDEATEHALTPWYRQQVERDRQWAGDVALQIAGEEPAVVADPARQMQAAFFAAAAVDSEVSRAALEIMGCLALPPEVMARPGMVEKVAPFLGDPPQARTGPTRAELLEILPGTATERARERG
jgi:2-polyprenyl-6-methoxyphenol hydroxylase-like FAD-dependent oxidoreductase